MSIIQKLEDSYLGILRVVVIVAASLLLVGAVVMGLMSLKGMLPASHQQADIERVDPADVLAKVVPDEKAATQPDAHKAAKGDEKKARAHGPQYDKIQASTSAFVTKYSKATLSINKDPLFRFLDAKSDAYDTDDLKLKYIDGLAAAMDATLLDARVIARVEKPVTAAKRVPPPAPAPEPEPMQAQDGTTDGEAVEPVQQAVQPPTAIIEDAYKESPVAVVEEVIATYTEMFNKKIEQAAQARNEKLAEQAQAKASSAMKLYVAGGVFGVFLLVIFLSIVIRIERNLRAIALKP